MPDIEWKPIVDEDGDLHLGRHATLWHVELGGLDTDMGIQPESGARFIASDHPAPHAHKVVVEYSPEGLIEAWEDTLFESPLHAEEVATDA